MGLVNTACKPYGDAAVAAMGVTLRVFCIAMYVVLDYNQGFQPVAGYNYGAKKYDRLTEAIKVSLKRTTVFCTISTAVFMIFANPIIGVFSNDADVIEIGAKILRAISLLAFYTLDLKIIPQYFLQIHNTCLDVRVNFIS